MSTTDDQLLYRPIIILGAPRSGTTFLGKILSKHPDVCYIEEPRFVWRYGNDRRSDLLRPEHATDKVRSYVRRTFAARMREQGRARLVEKSPNNSLRPEFVATVLDDCRFVHILRHGVESILGIRAFWDDHAHGLQEKTRMRMRSRIAELGPWRLPYYTGEFLRRMAPGPLRQVLGAAEWGPRLPGMRTMVRDLSPLEVAAIQWRACVEICCHYGRKLPSDRYYECRLEDLTPERLEDILRFCELPPSTEVTEFFQERYNPTLPTGRTANADSNDVETVRAIIEPTMRWAGLETPDPTPPSAIHRS